MLQLFSIFSIIFNDAPENWQLGFQDSATPGFTGITDLHDNIFFYLIIISVGVFWVLANVMYIFNSSKLIYLKFFIKLKEISFKYYYKYNI